MNRIIEEIYQKINIKEDIEIINDILRLVYLNEKISTKTIAIKNSIPIPIATAIKKELIKNNLLRQDAGVRISEKGKKYVEDNLGYKNIDIKLYHELLNGNKTIIKEFVNEISDIYLYRPQVDVTIDQAKCTVETSLNRAIMCLKNNDLIGKKILCLGDDDLVSVALAFIVKKLFKQTNKSINVVVADKDKRILEYIKEVSNFYGFNIECYQLDLKDKFNESMQDNFDCVITDPPYTMNGLKLFISRATVALKNKQDKTIYLSFGHKDIDFTLNYQKLLLEMNLVIKEITREFNEYEGASILGNTSHLLIIKTTQNSIETIKGNEIFENKIYTNEFFNSKRIYSCKVCLKNYEIGRSYNIKTIEALKENGCQCGNNKFDLISNIKEYMNNENTKKNGKHTIIDLYDCNSDVLNDLKQTEIIMLEAAKIAGATIVTSNFNQFNPQGISGVVIIKESHLTIHTWPEYNYAAIDIFTCGSSLEIEKASDYLKMALLSDNVKITNMIRIIK